MKKMKKVSKPKGAVKTPKKSEELGVTIKLLELTEQKITKRITALQLEMKAGFANLDSKFSGMMILLEEQNARNRFVLDGYTSIHDKQISTDKRIEEIEIKVFGKEQD